LAYSKGTKKKGKAILGGGGEREDERDEGKGESTQKKNQTAAKQRKAEVLFVPRKCSSL